MLLVDILAVLLLFLSFIGGAKDGAVKSFFPILSFIIAIPLTGTYYHLLAGIFSFLPGKDWKNLVGFFATLAIISLILNLIFLVPRKIIQKIWDGGCLFRVIGGALNVFSAAIGLVVLTLVVGTYPVFDWLAQALESSRVLAWLVMHLGFVKALLPKEFWDIASTTVMGLIWMR